MTQKHRKIIGLALKVAIVLLAVGYITRRFLFTDDSISFPLHLFRAIQISPLTFLAVLLLMVINWMLEGWKWKLAAGQQIKISFVNAIKGVLAGVTIGTATPNRIGEFAGRIFMQNEADRIPLLLLSFVCSFCQVVVTFLAGITGMLLVEENAGLSQHEMIFIYVVGAVFSCLPFLLPFVSGKWKERFAQLRKFPLTVFFKIFFLSALRYAVYVFQFMLLVFILRPEFFCAEVLGLVMVSYLVVTLIPTFSFTEVFVRGGIATLVFSSYGLERIGFVVAVLLWLINVGIPSLVGTFFVFRLKFAEKK
ncbi:MAG: lysylphosphatidylglycerol synthase domain-containing protein [Bacteroidota bacterium]|nr:lysylphosphatidylglycerol synthase domain-containing protein [Bacteroidota bacterium]